MPESPLRLIKRCAEYQPMSEVQKMPQKRRGGYVLYKKRKGKNSYSVVYIGMATSTMRGRLLSHRIRGHISLHLKCGTTFEMKK